MAVLGFLDGFRLGFRKQQPEPQQGQQHVPSPGPTRQAQGWQWVPAGHLIEIAGYSIPGGLLWMGRGLRTRNGSTEPALIDPSLRVDRDRPDWNGDDLFYWPSYDQLSPASRAAFLTWLAGGRRHPGVPIGYVFVFFYGLERRVLIDAMTGDPAATAELPAIEAETRELHSLYGADSEAFRRYTSSFLDLVEALRALPVLEPPAYGSDDTWNVPLRLRLGLARFATEGQPVPADWALSWSWFHPTIYARTPQTRCRDEFVALFRLRYRARHGDGLRIRSVHPGLQVRYYPASSGLLGADIELSAVPDVLEDAAPSRALHNLVEDITNDLDGFSRYVGRHPDQRDSLPAVALLPSDLTPPDGGPAHAFLRWARAAIGDDASAVVDASELIAFWPTDIDDRMNKKEVGGCALFLERHHIGIEPDARVGGPAISATTPVVLFDASHQPPRAASAEYAAATAVLQLAVAVAAADGTVDASEQEVLLGHLGGTLDLTDGEQERLLAHLHWLIATGSKLTGLTRRLQELSDERRQDTATLLAAVAAADGVVSPDEIKTLQKIHKMLGLDPSLVYSRVHERTSALAPAPSAGRRHARTQLPASTISRPLETRPGTVELDPAALTAAAAGTAAVSALLTSIFEDGPPDIADALDPQRAGSAPDDMPPVAGLDGAHSRLLRILIGRSSWTRAQFDAAAAGEGLLPDGALDTLNDLSYQSCGEPLLDDDADGFVLNDYAVQEVHR